MTIQEAVQILTNVCAAYTGNLKEHQNIQTALNTLVATINQANDPKLAPLPLEKPKAKKKK